MHCSHKLNVHIASLNCSWPADQQLAHPMVLAMSVQWGEERASAGAVVKPTWLLMIRWIVPPVVYPAHVKKTVTDTGFSSMALRALWLEPVTSQCKVSHAALVWVPEELVCASSALTSSAAGPGRRPEACLHNVTSQHEMALTGRVG